MNMDTSAICMILKDENKELLSLRQASMQLHETPLYTHTPTSKFLTIVAESVLQNESNQSTNYISIHRNNNVVEWDVLRSNTKVRTTLLPQFQRVRVVKINTEGCTTCSCGFFEENGLPCRHICHVFNNYFPQFTSFMPNDIDVRHFKGYSYFMSAKSSSKLNSDGICVKELYEKRRNEPCSGPKCNLEEIEANKYFAMGSGTEEPFLGFNYDTAKSYFDHRRWKVVILNYEAATYTNAIMQSSSEIQQISQVVGMREETFVGDDGNDDNEAVLPLEEEITDQNGNMGKEIVQPLLKELRSVLDMAQGEDFEEAIKVIKQCIQQTRKKIAPKRKEGTIVSCLVGSNNAAVRHKKQRNQFS